MSEFDSSIARIESAFNAIKLPGMEAQLQMSPLTRKMQESMAKNSVTARKSAVLILFYPISDKPHIAMIKRAPDNTVHSGQISFPGGKTEERDISVIDTALREANEEVGVDREKVVVIGQLSKLYIPPSNFDVFTIVGFTNEQPNFIINDEVDKLLEVDLDDLLNPKSKTYRKINSRDGNEYVVPCYYIQGEVIWGATGMILAELLSLIERKKSK